MTALGAFMISACGWESQDPRARLRSFGGDLPIPVFGASVCFRISGLAKVAHVLGCVSDFLGWTGKRIVHVKETTKEYWSLGSRTDTHMILRL